jgi:hypothetical protein
MEAALVKVRQGGLVIRLAEVFPMTRLVSFIAVSSFLLVAADPADAQSAKAKDCITIAGTISGTVTGSEPTTVQGTVTGTLAGSVHATITSLTPQSDGTIKLELTHDFVTDEGFLLSTQDRAKLIPVPGLANVFQQSTTYDIQSGTGRFANASGKFINHGETDLKRGLLTLRYEGQICGVAK